VPQTCSLVLVHLKFFTVIAVNIHEGLEHTLLQDHFD